jgi:ABC-type multidrug transport system ATPase subunit
MRIDLTNIEKIADGKKILDIEALTLESGKIYAVVGPNGAGKTTMLRIIAGCDRNYSGTVS